MRCWPSMKRTNKRSFMTRPALLLSILGVLWALPAEAGDYYIVAGEHTERAAAVAAAEATGAPAVRVSRQHIKDTGWRYLIRIDGFESADAARDAASSLRVAVPMKIYIGEGRHRRVVDVVVSQSPAPPAAVVSTPSPVTPPPGPPTPAASRQADVLPDASWLLEQSRSAHGGKKGGVTRLERTRSLYLRYQVETSSEGSPQVVLHELWRSGSSIHLHTAVLRGDWNASCVVVRDGKEAWIALHREVKSEEPRSAAASIKRFMPEEGLVGLVLGLAHSLKSESAWKGLRTRAIVQHNGRDHYRLTPAQSGTGHPMVAALVDKETYLISMFSMAGQGGYVSFDLADYRMVSDHLIVPFQIRTEDKGQVSQVLSIEAFEVDTTIEPKEFDRPERLRRKGRK